MAIKAACVMMSNNKGVNNKFLNVTTGTSNTLTKRIDDDFAKSMPNIHQSIPSSALVSCHKLRYFKWIYFVSWILTWTFLFPWQTSDQRCLWLWIKWFTVHIMIKIKIENVWRLNFTIELHNKFWQKYHETFFFITSSECKS